MDRVTMLQEYFCTLDEGMGTAYERYALNMFLEKLIERYKIESVIEVPANGVMGVPGLKSMLFGMAGCKVTLVNPSENVIATMEKLWEALELKADFVAAPYDDTGLPANHADLIWNFCVYEHFDDTQKVVDEMARISKKYVLVEIQNVFNLGMPLHKLYHRLQGEPWDHGETTKMRYTDVIADMHRANLAIAETGGTDMPPWPDINIRLKDVGKDACGLDPSDPACHLRPACVTKPCDQVIDGWNRIKQQPSWPDWMTALKLWYQLIEVPMPMPIRRFISHHPYVIGVKNSAVTVEEKSSGIFTRKLGITHQGSSTTE